MFSTLSSTCVYVCMLVCKMIIFTDTSKAVFRQFTTKKLTLTINEKSQLSQFESSEYSNLMVDQAYLTHCDFITYLESYAKIKMHEFPTMSLKRKKLLFNG